MGMVVLAGKALILHHINSTFSIPAHYEAAAFHPRTMPVHRVFVALERLLWLYTPMIDVGMTGWTTRMMHTAR